MLLYGCFKVTISSPVPSLYHSTLLNLTILGHVILVINYYFIFFTLILPCLICDICAVIFYPQGSYRLCHVILFIIVEFNGKKIARREIYYCLSMNGIVRMLLLLVAIQIIFLCVQKSLIIGSNPFV